MSKNTLLSELINYVSANSSGNVTIAAPSSGYALDVTGTGRFTGALTGTSITLSNSLNFTSIYGGNINGYDGTSLVPMSYSASQHQYYAGGTLKMTLLGNGNLLLGTTTDNGSKLQVSGTASFSGALSGTSATFSGQTRIETDGSTPQFFIKETDVTGQGSTAYFQLSNNTIYIGNGNASYGTLSDKLTIASSGAATFSSSVTAGSWILTSNNLFTGGNNTGVFLTGSSSDFSWGLNRETAGLTLYAGSASAPKMTITTGGNVGIGTTSPTSLFHIASTTTLRSRLYTSSGASFMDIENAGNSFYIGVDDSTGSTFGGSAYARTFYGTGAYPMVFWTNATERMRITSGGNVGIGTDSPQALLHLNKSSGSVELRLDGGYTQVAKITNGNAGAITFETGATERIRITSSGSVGIGTTSPNTTLEVYAADPTGTRTNPLDVLTIAADNSNNPYTGFGGGIVYRNRAYTGSMVNSARIRSRIHDDSTQNYGGGLVFETTQTVGSAYYNAMYIRWDGNVGISNANPTNRLQVSGNIYSSDTVFGRNLKPEAFASVSAGTPTGAGIPLGYSTLNISSPCDGNWRSIMSNINDVKGYFWVTLGDAASKDTANYFMAMTSVGYGVYNFGAVSYQDNGWNTGGFEFTYDTVGGTLRLLVRCTSYYSSANTAYGTIYFLRME